MKRAVVLLLWISIGLSVLASPSFGAEHNLDARLIEAAHTFQEFTTLPEDSIPRDFVSKARVILIFPNLVKGGYFYAGKYGLGVALVRDSETDEWSPPAFMRMSGGSFGLQIGLQWSDLIFIGKGDATLINMLQSRFSLGGNVSATAGPWGRHIEFDADWPLKSSIFSYGRSRGFFASAAVDGNVLSYDDHNNQLYYGRNIMGADILYGTVASRSGAARKLIDTIEGYALGTRTPVARLNRQDEVDQIVMAPNAQPQRQKPIQIVDEDMSILLVKNIVKSISVYFDYNSYYIRPDAAELLSEAASVLRRNPDLSIVISGHTDVRGSSEYNTKLGLQRAESIRTFFMDSGISRSRVKVISRGELDAAHPPSDLVGMQKDRYARFVIAELEKTQMSEAPLPSMQAEAIGDTLYMTREDIRIESDIKVATREYVVREGDTLWNISRAQLGDPHRWKHIYALNMEKINHADQLQAGQVLLIPIE